MEIRVGSTNLHIVMIQGTCTNYDHPAVIGNHMIIYYILIIIGGCLEEKSSSAVPPPPGDTIQHCGHALSVSHQCRRAPECTAEAVETGSWTWIGTSSEYIREKL